jgi:hypothetical protein
VPAYDQSGFDARLLDASVPQAERLKLFAHVIALAGQGQVRAQDLAGTMYWKGAAVAGSPVPVDLAQARLLLANAAVNGDIRAMVKLGELELQAKHVKQAMVWAQLYARYLDPEMSVRNRTGQRYAYVSGLMQRIIDAGGSVGADVAADVGNMVARYDTQIRSGIDRFRDERRSGNPRLISQPTGAPNLPPEVRNLSGVVEFMIAFDPSGAPTQNWLLACYPTASAAMAPVLRTYLDHVRANPVADGSGVRYLPVSMPFNSLKARQLRAVH